MSKAVHDKLVKAFAKLEASRRNIHDARQKCVDRAGEQLGSMEGFLHTVEQHREAGKGGGILGHRRHVTALHERDRLQTILSDHELRTDSGDES